MSKVKVSRDDRRRFPRVSASVQMRLKKTHGPDDAHFNGETTDVAVGGLRVTLRKQLKKGTPLHITFLGLAPKGQALEVTGRVAWSAINRTRGNHVAGIELVGVSQEQLDMLLHLVTERGWDTTKPAEPVRIHLRDRTMVEYRPAGGLIGKNWRQSTCRDLSLREAVLVTEEVMEPGSELKLRMLLPDGNPAPLPCAGIVAETRPDTRPGHVAMLVRLGGIADFDRLRLATFLSLVVLQ